jgi:hypothetical protein
MMKLQCRHFLQAQVDLHSATRLWTFRRRPWCQVRDLWTRLKKRKSS